MQHTKYEYFFSECTRNPDRLLHELTRYNFCQDIQYLESQNLKCLTSLRVNKSTYLRTYRLIIWYREKGRRNTVKIPN